MRYSHPFTIKFWYPYTATYATSTYGVTLKAPERGDSVTTGRNQTYTRTKAGNVIVTDFGVNLNNAMKLSFQAVPDAERSALVVFLDAVQWGSNILAYQDYKGNIRYIRIGNPNIAVTTIDEAVLDDLTTTVFDFTLDLIDVTDNLFETGGEGVTSTLALHIANVDHPHNPEVSTSLNISDGTKVIESQSVDSWKAVIWLITAKKDSTQVAATFIVNATHNGTASIDATNADYQRETYARTNYVDGTLTFTVDLSGVGALQVMRLLASTTSDGYTITCRRVKL